MYRRYAEQGNMGTAAMTSSAKSLVLLGSTAAIRPYIYDFTFGTVGTPSDSVVTLTATRFSSSAATNGTAFTPNPLDSVDAAATATCIIAATAEPTIGVVLFQVGLNVRATYRWVAAPGGELICPATANAGVAVRALSPAYTLDANATVYHAE
jgi:hypothetical protein